MQGKRVNLEGWPGRGQEGSAAGPVHSAPVETTPETPRRNFSQSEEKACPPFTLTPCPAALRPSDQNPRGKTAAYDGCREPNWSEVEVFSAKHNNNNNSSMYPLRAPPASLRSELDSSAFTRCAATARRPGWIIEGGATRCCNPPRQHKSTACECFSRAFPDLLNYFIAKTFITSHQTVGRCLSH